MSGVNTASANAAALSLLFGPSLTPQINKNSVLLHLLDRRPGEGKQVNFTAQFSGASNADSVADGTRKAYSDADNEIEVPGYVPWAAYEKVVSVSGLAQATAATTRYNPQSLTGAGFGGSLLRARIRDGATRLGLGIAQHCYSGTAAGGGGSSPQVIGVATSVDSTTDYANISDSTYPEWVSTENALSGDLSFDAIRQQLITPIYDACGYVPHVLATTSAIFDKLRGLYGSTSVPYLNEIVTTDANGRERVVRLGAGMQAISVDGIPVVRDRHCTSGVIYGLNLDYLWLEQLPEMPDEMLTNEAMLDAIRQFTGDPSVRIPNEVLEGLASQVRNPAGIVPYFKMLGATGDSDEVLIKAKVQMVNSRRNAHGKLTGVS